MAVIKELLSIDQSLFHFINRDLGIVVDWVAVAISHRIFGIVLGILVCVWQVKTARSKSIGQIVALGLAILIADGVGARLIRPLIGRVRPCYFLPEGTFRNLAFAANAGSFPSLHAANFFALAFIGSLANRKLAVPLYAIAIAVALSRVYLGVHWPLDVVAGAVWGTFCAWVAWQIANFGFRRNKQYFGASFGAS
jgi:undecaprenyl-diphosphatase